MPGTRPSSRFSPSRLAERWVPVLLVVLAILLVATLGIVLMAMLGVKL